MADGQDSGEGGQAEEVPELEPKEFEQLVDVVYKLIRDEMLLELERSGDQFLMNRWR